MTWKAQEVDLVCVQTWKFVQMHRLQSLYVYGTADTSFQLGGESRTEYRVLRFLVFAVNEGSDSSPYLAVTSVWLLTSFFFFSFLSDCSMPTSHTRKVSITQGCYCPGRVRGRAQSCPRAGLGNTLITAITAWEVEAH